MYIHTTMEYTIGTMNYKQEIRETVANYDALFELAYEYQLPVHPQLLAHRNALEQWLERYGTKKLTTHIKIH